MDQQDAPTPPPVAPEPPAAEPPPMAAAEAPPMAPPTVAPPPVAPPPPPPMQPTGPVFTIKRPLLGAVQLLADGTPLRRKGSFGATYLLPMPDGTTREVQLRGAMGGARVVVDGVERQLEPPLNPIFTVLAVLPLALIAIGGVIGAVIGVVAAAINLTLARRPLSGPIKAIAMLGVLVLSVVAWFGAAVAISPLPRLTVGECVDGIRGGANLDASVYDAIDCNKTHDSEIVGIVTHGAGSFPGQAALLSFAEAGCLDDFRSYVGIDQADSVLEMIGVTPDETRWAKGDHDIVCAVVGPNGLPMTSSVKGTAR